MTPEEEAAVAELLRVQQAELAKVLAAHARTIEICAACATTTRDLAIEVKRGGVPARDDLQQTIDAADTVLDDLRRLRDETARVLAELSSFSSTESPQDQTP